MELGHSLLYSPFRLTFCRSTLHDTVLPVQLTIFILLCPTLRRWSRIVPLHTTSANSHDSVSIRSTDRNFPFREATDKEMAQLLDIDCWSAAYGELDTDVPDTIGPTSNVS